MTTLSDEELSEIERACEAISTAPVDFEVTVQKGDPRVLRAWMHASKPSRLLALLSDLRSLREERVDELQHDLELMMRSRQVLLEGIGKVLLACGNYVDCQERGWDYPLEQAMQDVLDASQAAVVAHCRIMDAASPEEGETDD